MNDSRDTGVFSGNDPFQTNQIVDFQKKIKELETRANCLYGIFNHIPDAIIIQDINGTLFDLNEAACKLFGIDKISALQYNASSFMSESHMLDTLPVLWKDVCSGNGHVIKCQTRRLNNQEQINAEVSLNATTWYDKQAIIAVFHVLSTLDGSETNPKERELRLKHQNEKLISLNDDLAESYRQIQLINEQLIIAKERAVESDHLKSAFLANMSHEIRTPMNWIIGFAHMLSEKGLDQESLNQYVSIINNCSYQLLTIIDDIIDISKIEAGQLHINNTSVNINTLLLELQSFYAPIAQEANIGLEVRTGLSDESCTVVSDPVRLRQVLNNLINNAIKFTSNGKITFGYEVNPSELEFFVADTGIGISPEYHKLIFERFRQVEHSETRNFRGTGLGLAICKALVNLMCGVIWVESMPNQGSTFKFRIPLKMLDNVSKPQKNHAGKSELLNLKVLL
jgi:PAS domain S-box-containing protein